MVTLREVQAADADTILAWRNCAEVSRYMFTDQVITPEQHATWFQRVSDDRRHKLWIIVAESKNVGLANLYDIDWDNRRCYWGSYIADPGQRGRGIGSATELLVLSFVFDRLLLNKLNCEVLSFNTMAIAVHMKFGFTKEGLLRQHVYKSGRYHDVVSLGVLRQEWQERKHGLADGVRQKCPGMQLPSYF